MSEQRQLKQLIKKRATIKGKLTNFGTYLKSLKSGDETPDPVTIQIELQLRLEKVEALYDEFDGFQSEIEELCESSDDEFKERHAFEMLYYSLVSAGRALIASHRKLSMPSHDSTAAADYDDPSDSHKLYGKLLPTLRKETQSISIDPIQYGEKGNYFRVGDRVTLVCKGGSKSQKVEWVNPEGEVIQRDVRNRVYAQEHFVASHKTRMPALLLIISHATVDDTGVWQCRSGTEYLINSGSTAREVSLCIIEPSSFVNTPTDVTVDHGRSITLACQARGEPEPRLQWYRNGEIVTDDPNSSKYELMTQYHSQGFAGLLTILSVEGEDSGEYNCEAIQESPRNEECSARIQMNITLHVNYPPEFYGGNETALVAGQENKSVDLVCAADAYPTPTYRWFQEVGDILSEYPKEVIELQNNGQEAVLTITANSSTFGHRFRCRATNEYGEVDKVFSLVNLVAPRKPDEIALANSNHEEMDFHASWKGDVFFPVDYMKVQYLKKDSLRKKSLPREIDWVKATEIDVPTKNYDLLNEEETGLRIVLLDLEEETDYWVRMRAVNEAGSSPWSKPIPGWTIAKSEEDTEETSEEEVDETDKPKTGLSDSMFYGVFFAGGIAVVAVGCMLIMRMV